MRASRWLFAGLVLLLGPAAASATPPIEFSDPHRPVSLSVAWKFHSGDDLAWARPDYDDSDWPEKKIPIRDGDHRTDAGFAWFRLAVQVASPQRPLGKEERADLDLGLRLGKVTSAYEVYAGGIYLGGVGSLPPTPKINYDRHRVYAIPMRAIDEKGQLLLALRVWKSSALPMELRGPHEGPFYLGKLVELTRRELISEMPQLFLVSLFSLLGLYHLELWRRRPQLTSYGWFSVFAICIAAYTLLDIQWRYLLTENFLVLKEIEHLLLYLMLVLGIQFFSSLLSLRIGAFLRFVQATALVAGLLVVATPGLRLNLLFLPFLEVSGLAVTAFVLWRVVCAAWRAQPEARIITLGTIVFWLTVFNDIGMDLDLLNTPRLMHFGFAASVLSFAVSLANKFMRTYDELDELRIDLQKRGEELAGELAARQRLEADREQLLREIEEKNVLDTLSRQNRFFVELLRAESPGHLAALRDELREIETLDQPGLHPQFFAELRRMLDGVGTLAQLPTSDDRAFVLGQALTQALAMQEHLADEEASRPALGGMALETVQQVFASALQDVQQHAEIEVELRSKHLTARREAVIVLDLKNAGRADAGNVAVELIVDDEALVVPRPDQYLQSLRRAQTARLEFLAEVTQRPLGRSMGETRPSVPVRLAFRVTWDDPQRTDQSRRFVESVELRRFEEPAVFRPLKPNPYVIGRPLLPADPFFGRQKFFARLRTSLEGAQQDNVLVLIGQRRMGKTSILRRLDRHLPENYVSVFVDLQGLLGTGEPSFFREIVGQIVDELEERDIQVAEPTSTAFETDPGNVFRRRFLSDVRGVLGGRRLLIIFDELEVLEERIQSGKLTPGILPYLRSLLQHESDVAFLLAGTHRLDELTADYWGVLFNLAIHLDVGHLAQSDIEALFVEPTKESFDIDSLALEKIYRTTGGHPHFSQLLARELVEFCNRQKLSYVTVQDVNQVTGIVADKGQLHITYLWDEASRDERLLLLAMLELLDREGLASLQAVHHCLTRHRLKPVDLPEAARRLRRKEILVEQAGQLSFGIDLLRRWLETHHDLESFILSEKARS
jgi:hypothetical protein